MKFEPKGAAEPNILFPYGCVGTLGRGGARQVWAVWFVSAEERLGL